MIGYVRRRIMHSMSGSQHIDRPELPEEDESPFPEFHISAGVFGRQYWIIENGEYFLSEKSIIDSFDCYTYDHTHEMNGIENVYYRYE